MTNKDERKPEFRYNGQYVMEYTSNNVVGDTAWDCDYGYLKWDGSKWKQYTPKKQEPLEGDYIPDENPEC